MLKFAAFHPPPKALRDYVWHFIVLEERKGDSSSFNYDVVPIGDACVNFVILNWAAKEKGQVPPSHPTTPGGLPAPPRLCQASWVTGGLKGRAGRSFLLVSGPMSKPARLLVTPKQVVVARLKAGAFQVLFGASPDKAKDKVILLEKFWGAEAKALASGLCQAPDTGTRLAVLAEALACRALAGPQPDFYAQAAVEMMRASDGALGLKDLAGRLGYTERQVERKFQEGLGLAPKEFQRLLRCRVLILRILNEEIKDWTRLASDFGYSDQSHLIREFKSFMGLPPEKFTRKFKQEGRILEGPFPGIKDEGAMLGYAQGLGETAPGYFTPLTVEELLRHSGEYPGPDAPPAR
jgi:AraC-like DNA-binding protein